MVIVFRGYLSRVNYSYMTHYSVKLLYNRFQLRLHMLYLYCFQHLLLYCF